VLLSMRGSRTSSSEGLHAALGFARARDRNRGLVLFPVYWMFVPSVLPSSLVLSASRRWCRRSMRCRSRHTRSVRRRPVLTWLMNSTIVVVGSVTISLAISALAGYSLSRFQSPAQRVAGGTLLLSKMLPGS
jgi:multiple sugar transport system permease protein